MDILIMALIAVGVIAGVLGCLAVLADKLEDSRD